jgi:hypothetical protein
MDPRDVAEWMVDELKREKFLNQEHLVFDIQSKFGNEFTYTKDNGNLAIDKRVLREFRKLTEDSVVWDRSERLWRMREKYDTPGKRQTE